MIQDKEDEVEVKRRKVKKAKSFFSIENLAGFSGLPPHLCELGAGIELCGLAPLWLFVR